MPFDKVVDAGNDPRFRTGVVPAGNGVATANELSRFYELLRGGGELDGVRIFDPRTIRRARAEQSYHEIDLTLGLPQRFSLGFMLGSKHLSLYGPDTEQAFGHLGFTNIIGLGRPRASAGGRHPHQRQAGALPRDLRAALDDAHDRRPVSLGRSVKVAA